MRSVAIAVLLASLAACTTEATETLVVVDTDLRDLVAVSPVLRVTVLHGNGAPTLEQTDAGIVFGDAGLDATVTWTVDIDAGARDASLAARDAGIELPASFAIVPAAGESHADTVTMVLEAIAAPYDVRRIVRFQFVPGTTNSIRVFLAAACGAMDRTCSGSPCSREEFCERIGLTCGNDGDCVGFDDTGPLDASAPAPPFCGDRHCNIGETACSCPSDCMSVCGDGCCTGTENPCDCAADHCAVRAGDGCCSAGENACNAPGDCPPACGDGCCNGTETSCSCASDCGSQCGDGCCDGSETSCSCVGDCGEHCGDGCCNGGETSCSCAGDCGARCGDGCCNGGENTCNCPGDCGGACGDGCCNAGETTCSCPNDCGTACGDGCCNGGESCHDCPGDCGTAACTCRVDCCNPTASGGAGFTYQPNACDCRNQYTWCTDVGTVSERINYGGTIIYQRVPNGSGSYCAAGSSDPGNACICPSEC